MTEYKNWLKQNPSSNPDAKVISSVIDDDVAEAEAHERKRADWGREYNDKSIPTSPKPKLKEKE